LITIKKGYFVRFRPALTATTFTAGFNFISLINLQQPGTYVISFYSFIYCPKVDCDTGDTIILKIKQEDEVDFRIIYSSGVALGRVRDLGWVKDSIVFSSLTPKINVNILSIN
jgi:hypothetical protein